MKPKLPSHSRAACLSMCVAALLLSACVTEPTTQTATGPKFKDDDCYVTGSNIRVSRQDCARTKSDRGVITADPEALKPRSAGLPRSQ